MSINENYNASQFNNNYNTSQYTGNVNASQYTSQLDPSLFQSVTDQNQLNSIIKNMETDNLDRPIKYAKPTYMEVQKTYKELAPITNAPIEMPMQYSKKVRQLETVYQKPVYLDENAGMSQILNNNNFEDIPLPTNSMINNLIQDSVMQSSTSPEIPIPIQSNIGKSNYNNLGMTKYEQRLRAEEAEKSRKSQALNSKINSSNKNSSIKPEVNQGEGLVYSSIKQGEKNSIIESKINQTIMLPGQSNVLQNNNNNNKSIKNQSIPQNQSNVHQKSIKQSNYPNPQSKMQSQIPQSQVINKSSASKHSQINDKKSSIKPSTIPLNESQMKKSSKINNNNNIAQNPIGIYETTMMPSTIKNSNNINNNNIPTSSNIKKNPIGIYETTMMQSNIPEINNNQSHNINKNPIGIYETTMMQSNIPEINNNNNNQISPSIQASKDKEFNVMKNKTTMGNYNNQSFPMSSHYSKSQARYPVPENPFKSNK